MPQRKLTDQQAAEIRRRVDSGETLRSIAKVYGVAFSTIRNVATRQYRLPFRKRVAA
jgi:DNA invertase Pin-like site-specific DNA recombinase